MITDNQKKRDIFNQLFSRLHGQGVHPVWNSYDQDILLIWSKSADADELKDKRILAVIDEDICKKILSDKKDNYVHLDKADQTIVTRDAWFSMLNRAGLLPNDPVVVQCPPDPSVFKGKKISAKKNRGNMKCVVFSDANFQRYESLSQEIDRIENVSFTLIGNLEEEWNGKSDQHKVDVLHEHDFALVLSKEMGPDLIDELLACGLPCLYHESRSDIRAVVGMAGLAFGTDTDCFEGIISMRDNSECYKAAILLPSPEEAALTIRDIIFHVSRSR